MAIGVGMLVYFNLLLRVSMILLTLSTVFHHISQPFRRKAVHQQVIIGSKRSQGLLLLSVKYYLFAFLWISNKGAHSSLVKVGLT